MPFELGLAAGWALSNTEKHNWYVLETRAHRLEKSLNDLNGFEPFIRGYGVDGILRAVTDMFLRPGAQPSAQDLKNIYKLLSKKVGTIKSRSGSTTLFAPRTVKELVLAANVVAKELLS